MSFPGCSSRPRLQGDIFLEQLRTLAEIGLDPRGGRTRLALSGEDKTARDMMVGWMKELDLHVKVDRIGNIFGILSGKNDEKPLTIGSHIDTVISAGPFDGCYGVLSALAVARAFREAELVLPRSLIVAAFTNEEGVRFQPDMMGSLAFAGGISLGEVLAAKDENGVTVEDALKTIGYFGEELPGFFIPSDYLELHVEQGPVLEEEGYDIGVVEGVQGISWWRISIAGVANHAGTTPMTMRRDAGYAAARISVFLREWAKSSGTTLTTVGTLSFEPGAINVIPSTAILTADIRDPDGEKLSDADRSLMAFLGNLARNEEVKISSKHLVRFEPVNFSKDLADSVERSSRRRSLSCRRMVSGAGHDAQMMARICNTGMIFVPSRGGISHSPMEFTEEKQLIQGAEVLLDVAMDRLGVF